MKKYHVKVAFQTLETYEVEAEDAETASECWDIDGKLIDADDEALENTFLSVEEVKP
jgi:hypothetical protein